VFAHEHAVKSGSVWGFGHSSSSSGGNGGSSSSRQDGGGVISMWVGWVERGQRGAHCGCAAGCLACTIRGSLSGGGGVLRCGEGRSGGGLGEVAGVPSLAHLWPQGGCN